MSLKKVQQVKKDKLFRLWDIPVYGVIVTLIVVLFVVFVFTADRSALSAIEVYYDNTLAFYYSFEQDEYTVYLSQNIAVEEGESSLTVTFCTDSGNLQDPSDYNIIYIDKSATTVSVTQSDCSNRKDCVHTSAIKDSAGSIACTPHRLVIVPSDYTDDGQTLPIG